jgi:streptogramin lyase
MAKAPGDRVASAGELARAAGGALADGPSPRRARRRAAAVAVLRRRGASIAWLLAAAGAGVAVGTFLLNRDAPRPPPTPAATDQLEPGQARVADRIGTGGGARAVLPVGGTVWVGGSPPTRIDIAHPERVRDVSLRGWAVDLLEAFSSVWVVNLRDGRRELRRLAPDSGRPLGPPVRLGGSASSVDGIAELGGSIWVLVRSPRSSTLLRVNPSRMKVAERVPLGRGDRLGSSHELAAGDLSLWVMSPGGTLMRVSPYESHARRRFDVGGRGSLAFGAGALWIARYADGKLLKLAPATGRLDTIDTGEGAIAVAARGPLAWVTTRRETRSPSLPGALVRLDTRTNRLIGRPLPVGPAPNALAVTSRDVWVADDTDGTVTRVEYRP